MQQTMIGPYDKLYSANNLLWGEKPGRLLPRLIELSQPGYCLDLGCGDGKNLVYLESQNWTVDGVDISSLAIERAKNRFIKFGHKQKGELIVSDAINYSFRNYHAILCYGLFHCLHQSKLKSLINKIKSSLSDGGYLIFTYLNDEVPLPEDHETLELFLHGKDEILTYFPEWELIEYFHALIHESHLPLVGEHVHAATWGILRKR